MKKKLISLFLVVAMVMSMMVMPVAAEGEDAAEPATLTPGACAKHTEVTEWNEIGENTWTGGTLAAGHYKLTGNQATTSALVIAADTEVCIDLNGFNITAGAKANSKNYRVFENSGALTVMDSVGTGVISGGRKVNSSSIDGSWSSSNYVYIRGGNIFNEGTFNLYGGTVSDGIAHFGNVYCTGQGGNYYGSATSTLNMYGGAITGGQLTSTSYALNSTLATAGGNIYSHGTVNISGGTISGGRNVDSDTSTSAKRSMFCYGGNIAVVNGTLNISGGTINDGQAFGIRTNTTTYGLSAVGYGGNIYAYESAVTISGGTVSNGQAKSKANTVGQTGYAFMTGDCLGCGGNIYLAGGSFEMTGGAISGGSAMLDITNSGVTDKDGSLKEPYARGGNLFLSDVEATISGGTITGGTVSRVDDAELTTDDYGTTQGGSVYLTSSVTLEITGTANISGGANAQGNGGTIYQTGGTLTISGGNMGTPAVEATETTEAVEAVVGTAIRGGTIFVGGTVNVTGGTIYGGSATSQGGSIYNNKTLNISGNAVITKGYADVSGGNIFNAGTVNMTGGMVSDGCTVLGVGSEGTGGNVQNGGTFNMSGGIVSGGMAFYRGGNFFNAGSCTLTLSGNAVVTGGTLDYDYNINNGISNTRYTASFGGNYYGGGILKMYDNAVIKDGVAYNGGNVHTATNNGKIYMYGGAIYGGRVANTGSDLRLYNNANVEFHMYGGFVEHLNDGGTSNVIQLYNGVFGNDISKVTTTSGATALMACAHYTTLDNGYYNVWHADGTCATCGHSFGAYEAEEVTCATCSTSHETLGGEHTYVDGACSVCGKTVAAHTAACSHDCENVEWVPFDGAAVEDGGHYYLTDNVALAEVVTVDAIKVCIDLNGFVLTAPPAYRAFLSTNGGELSLMDSSAENTGVLRGFSLPAAMHGGNLRVNTNSTLNLYDLTVTGGTINGVDGEGNRGGNIYVYGTGSKLVIDNAKVTNGKIVDVGTNMRGGNICVYLRGTVIIKGEDAKVTGGTAYGTSSNCYGGNIHSGQGGFLYIYDGEVSGGNSKTGANICWMNGELADNQGGTVHMYGGTVGAVAEGCSGSNVTVFGNGSYQNDFYMYGGEIQSLSFRENAETDSYVGGAIYGGTLGTNPAAVSKTGTMIAPCAVVSYDEQTNLYTLSHVNTEHTCNICAGNDAGYANGYSASHIYTNVAEGVAFTVNGVVYTDLQTALGASQAGQTITMFENVEDADYEVEFSGTLDLNGHTLTTSDAVNISFNDSFITDSVGTGSITAEMGVYTKEDNNGMLAIDAANDGKLTFEKVDVVQKVRDITDAEGNPVAGQKSVKFYIDEASTATKLDDAIAAGSDVEIMITVYSEALTDGSHSFTYTDDLVQQYLAKWDSKIFTCEIVGLDASLGEYSIKAEVKSNGVVVAAYDFVG